MASKLSGLYIPRVQVCSRPALCQQILKGDWGNTVKYEFLT